jgi:cytoskeleton protein RodZ
MSAKVKKNENKSLFDGEPFIDTSVSEAINEAFDNASHSSVGKLCLDARVTKSLTQEQASSILKVRLKIIKDFESGEPIDLPGLAYKVGFVRSYARLLGLDSDLLVKEFKESLELNDFKEEYKFLTPEIERSKLLPMGVVLSFFISTIIYTGWYYSDRNNNVNVVSTEPIFKSNEDSPKVSENKYIIIEESFDLKKSILSNVKEKNNLIEDEKQNLNIQNYSKEDKIRPDLEVVQSSKDKIQPIKNQPQTNEMSAEANERDPSTEMVLKALGNSWVEIEDIDGNVLMTRLMRPGETYVVPNITGLTFNTGNAGALSLSQGDIIVPALGSIGEIIKARPLNIRAFSN